MFTRYRLVAALAAVLVVMLAAGTAALAVSFQEEVDLGEKVDAQVMKEFKLYSDEAAQKEMNDYGQKLAKFATRQQLTFHFKILDDKEFNAFSTPGGYVYFTQRLWNVLRKDERIGVIAHEIVHTDRRHALDAISKQQRRRLWLAVILTAAKASDLVGNVASIAEQMYSLKYSRGDEEQADKGAVEMCQKAGYNPAGILLSMYKIGRFESESGGAPPKIFSDHPPTKERLQYITQLLTSKGVPIPPQDAPTVAGVGQIGKVASVASDNITFSSTKALQPGEIVWVMRDGWDFYYEKKTPVPFARAEVTATAPAPAAKVWLMPSNKKTTLAKGMDVCAMPAPAPEKGVGLMRAESKLTKTGVLQLDANPKLRDRYLAMQAVWNSDNTKLVNDCVGYVVVTNPGSKSGYVAMQRPKYAYAPMQADSVLVQYTDADQQRWIGPVISIGRSGGTIEVSTSRQLDKSKTYDVLYPAWNKDDSYKKRTVGTAKFDSAGEKIVLKMATYSPGYGVSDLQNGFDVYESGKAAK